MVILLIKAILRVEISSPPAPADPPRARPLTTPPRSVPGSTLELLLPTDTRPVPLPPNCPNLPVRLCMILSRKMQVNWVSKKEMLLLSNKKLMIIGMREPFKEKQGSSQSIMSTCLFHYHNILLPSSYKLFYFIKFLSRPFQSDRLYFNFTSH